VRSRGGCALSAARYTPNATGAGQQMVEVELSAADAKRPLRELHEAYRVDTASQKLVKKAH